MCRWWRWTARTGGPAARKASRIPIDAYAAARAVLTATRTTVPKTGDGIVEAIRALRVTRRSAVKARTQTINQLKSLLVTAPPEVRERLQHLKTQPWCRPACGCGPAACCRIHSRR